MNRHHQRRYTLLAILSWAAFAPPAASAASPSAEQALRLRPVQQDVDYARPDMAQAAKCTIKAQRDGKQTGWVVEDADGATLRRFVDTNGDNVVDLWCYYLNDLEVYRDVDANFNGKADQYRWLGTGGTRWGIDRDEDGVVDTWQVISAEEVTSELIEAVRHRDAQRFARLVLTEAELQRLGAGQVHREELAKKITAAGDQFAQVAKSQKTITAETKWLDFGTNRPGTIPAGTQGSTSDIVVYENVVAMIETAGKYEQVSAGTLVRVDGCWRIIGAPRVATDEAETAAAGGFFFQTSTAGRNNPPPAAAPAVDERLQKLLADLEQLDQDAAGATSPKQQAEVNVRRVELLERLADEAATADARESWLRQLADTISIGVQSGAFENGVQRLDALHKKLAASERDQSLAAYVKFRFLTADYGQQIQAPNADFAKIQADWLARLEKYVGDHPSSPDTAEAMLQLAFAQEHAGNADAAINWYGRIVKQLPEMPSAKKAAGARRRLESVGKVMSLGGKMIDGRNLDLSQLRGKVVLVHYWASWSEPCKADLARLKAIQAKFARDNLAIVSVNLDNNREDVVAFLRGNRLPWYHIHESGGLDSRLANEMGILTLPTMILVDARGKVIDRGIHAGQLDAELKKHLR